jgi:AraC-like DNA-binding protein/quercetin dioxygenase-like cupin family protein
VEAAQQLTDTPVDLTVPPVPSPLEHAEVLYAQAEEVPAGGSLGQHTHAQHELLIITRGHLIVRFDDTEFELTQGQALLVPRFTKHEERAVGEDPVRRFAIGINWSRYDHQAPLHIEDRGGRLHELSAWLSVERHSSFPRVDEYRKALCFSALAEFERLRFDASSAIEKRTRTFILSRLSEHISLEDMAKNAGMSRHHFSRLYRRLTGQTPTEYLRTLRLERARHLIKTTPQPLKVVAAQVGLASEHHLSRLLRKSFGVGVRDLRGRAPVSGFVPAAHARHADS